MVQEKKGINRGATKSNEITDSMISKKSEKILLQIPLKITTETKLKSFQYKNPYLDQSQPCFPALSVLKQVVVFPCRH